MTVRSLLRRPTLLQVRLLLLILGVGLSMGQALVAWERGAPPTEVLAPILYIPVFAGAILAGIPGGLAAAAVSSLVYFLVLVDQSASLGMRLFLGLLLSRTITFVFYGLVVAAGTRFIERRLQKLEIYDRIDDDTELYNASFFLETSDLEKSRATRYRTVFSVAEVRVDRDLFEGKRNRRRVVRELAHALRDGIRGVDRLSRVQDQSSERFLFILPETGKQGSETLTGRLEAAARQVLTDRNVEANGHLSTRALTFPDDEHPIDSLRQEVAAIEAERQLLADAGVTR